jgi:hypothetical protein
LYLVKKNDLPTKGGHSRAMTGLLIVTVLGTVSPTSSVPHFFAPFFAV